MVNEIELMGDNPLTAQQIKAGVNLIQQVMASVMKDGIHYGKIPGCGDKPALLKPGAEKILTTFRISADPQIEDLGVDGEIRYRVKVIGRTPNRVEVGFGVGECSTGEEKYRWKGAVCQAEYDETPEDRRRMKFYRDGRKVPQIRTQPADIANTVLKMAKKRALVDLCLTATAASDCFSQDLEDMEPEVREAVSGEADKPVPITPPQRKSEQAPPTEPAPAGEVVSTRITEIKSKSGQTADKVDDKGKIVKKGKPWTVFFIETEAGSFGTFSDTIVAVARELVDSDAKITWVPGKKEGTRECVHIEAIL